MTARPDQESAHSYWGSPKSRVAGNNLRIDLVAAEVVGALKANGTEGILLKGATTSRWLYPEGGRPYSDVDLLVSIYETKNVSRVLDSLGFDAPPAPIKHDRPREASPWSRESDGAEVDIHTTLWGVEAPREEVWRILRSHTHTIVIRGTEIEALNAPARALHLAIHALKHGPTVKKPLADLARAVEVLPFDLWRETCSLAKRLGAADALGAGLRLVPRGRAVADELGIPPSSLIEIILASSSAPPMATTIEWLSRLPGLRQKFGLVLRKAFPSSSYLRSVSPMAGTGGIDLVFARLARPLVLASRAGPAFLAWRRAKRHCRSEVRRNHSSLISDDGCGETSD